MNGNNLEMVANDLGIRVRNHWLRLLRTLNPYEIGVAKASGKLIEGDALERLADEVSYLTQENVGIYLPLVIGGGVQYDLLPSYKKGRKIKGLRVTTNEMMREMLPLALEKQEKTVDALVRRGADAVAIPANVIYVDKHGNEIDINGEMVDMGYVGDIVGIDTKPIISAVLSEKIPVLSHIGLNNGEEYNINATTVAAELVRYLNAKKLILLGDTPIRDNNGEIIHLIDSELHFERLVREGVIRDGMVINGRNAYRLLSHLGPGHSVQITALSEKSVGLLEELLGDGVGTMVVMPHIVTSYPLDAVDSTELTQRINRSFSSQGNVLVPNYFDLLKERRDTTIFDSMKKGGAITYPMNGYEYLCKIFTDKDFEGQGIATSVIGTAVLHKGAAAWRTSLDNKEAVDTYKRIARKYNGFAETFGSYMVFGINIPAEQKQRVRQEVALIPPTLQKAA